CPTCGAAAREPADALPSVIGYRLLEELGRGRTGTVYRARQLLHGRVVAFRLISDEALAGLHDLRAFCAEGRAAARPPPPTIAAVYEAGDAAGCPYLAAEFLGGETLQQKLASAPPSAGAAARLVETLARAVQHAHEQHVTHGALSPGNVFLAADGTPRIS